MRGREEETSAIATGGIWQSGSNRIDPPPFPVIRGGGQIEIERGNEKERNSKMMERRKEE
jgi:hypothetical protein